MILYHGSDQIVERPLYKKGREDNDYGKGFYLTEEKDKANAWAVVNGTDRAFCNLYDFPIEDMNVLHLDDHGVLVWIAEVTFHRGVLDEDTFFAAQRFVEMYKLDTLAYDVIIGYRADDSYIKVIDSFLRNQLNTDEVERFFRKGELGEQVFIQSQKAFHAIRFLGYEEVAEKEPYRDYDVKARREVETFLNNRRKAMQLEGFVPYGLTIREVIDAKFVYDSEYRLYQPALEMIGEKGEDDHER